MVDKLAIIGFDAQLDGLKSVDQVAAACYRGDLHHCDTKLSCSYDYSSLCQQSITRVLNANNLTEPQVSVIYVAAITQDISAADSHFVASLGDALELTVKLIREHDCAVLIIAANLQHTSVEPQQMATISFDQVFSGYGQQNGVGCILLSSRAFAAHHNRYIYGYVNGFAVGDINDCEQIVKQSLADCNLSCDLISSVEVSALAEVSLSDLEQTALLASYKNNFTLHSSLSCVKSIFGENGAFSELLGLLNVVFALQQRYRSGILDWTAPQIEQLDKWGNSPFYLLNDSAPAYANKEGKPRHIAYSCLSSNKYAHIIIQENNDKQIHSNGFNAHSELSLFIVVGDSQTQLVKQLQALSDALVNSEFKALAKQFYQRYLQNSGSQYRGVLLAESTPELAKEITLAMRGIPDAFLTNKEWKTPQGSYFTANPSSDKPKVSFMYPGIGATYLGLGRDLLLLFPEIYTDLLSLSDNLEETLKDTLLNPRTLVRLSFDELKKRDLALRRHLASIAECGVGYACVFTKIFTDVFAIKADFATGYSMGEVSMFAALGCWKNTASMSARLASSNTFNEQLAGELKTVRASWNLSASVPGERPIWESYHIKGSQADVQKAILKNERVYITLINTPDSLVIAGFPDHCLAVAKRLAVRPIALNVHNAIHSEPAYQQYQEMVELYNMELGERISTKLYSSSCYLPVPFNNKAIAVSLAKCLCQQVDFPRLINSLAAQGSRVFIEMGAGNALCSWTDKILASNLTTANNATPKNHISVAVNGKGRDPKWMFVRALAKLVSFGVKADLNSFFYGSIIQPCESKQINKR